MDLKQACEKIRGLRRQVQFRLLVVRLGAMGDILHALPAVTALRRAHPTWVIGWAVEPRWRGLLSCLDKPGATDESTLTAQPVGFSRPSGQPLVDGVHLVPAKAWGRRPLSRETLKGIGGLRDELRGARYDAVLDLQGSIRSALLARLSGCRRILGAEEPWEGPARWLYTERVETLGRHVIEQGVELARAVAGDLLVPGLPELPRDAGAEAWCNALPARLPEFEPRKPVVLINPGAGWGAKRWPVERFGVVAEALNDLGATVLVNAGPGEEALAATVVRAAHGRAAAVECSLEQLVALTRRVALVIGGDTGPVHLGCALGKPVVGIFGPTDPKRNGPFGSPFRVLRNPESRRDHSRRAEPEAGLLTISPETVIDAALELMAPRREAKEEGDWDDCSDWNGWVVGEA